MQSDKVTRRDIHLQQAVQALAAAIIHSKDWTEASISIEEMNVVVNYWKELVECYGADAVQEISFDAIESRLRAFLIFENTPWSDEEQDAIVNYTMYLLALDVEDGERFESWFKKIIKEIVRMDLPQPIRIPS